MNRRFYIILIFALLLGFVCASSALAETMYVSTQDGDPLNVRDKPLINANTLIGSLPNHSKVEVISIDSNGWAKIKYHTNTGRDIIAYVSVRYLSYDQAGHYRSSQSATPQPTSAPKQVTDIYIEELNAELKTVKTITEPLSLLVRPARATGRVNLRWAPSNKIRSIITYPANKKLIAIAETNEWYQVRDPELGQIGFISKKLVTVLPRSTEQ